MSLKPNDLEELIDPIVEIDTFESKLDSEKTIVVAFFVDDSDPAKDLNRFIKRSAFDIVDAEVSPAPDENGNYAVFVELDRDKKFIEALINILDSLKNVTGIKEWRFKPYKKDKNYPVDEKHLKKYVRLKQKKTTKEAEVLDYLKDSHLTNATLNGSELILEYKGQTISYNVLDFDTGSSVLLGLEDISLSLTEGSRRETSLLESMMGANWISSKVGEFITLHNLKGNHMLLLK